MKKIYIQNLFIILALLFSCFSYAQKKAKDAPKTFKQEMTEVEVGFAKSETIKRIGEAITRAGMDKTNRDAVSKTTQKILKYSKNMSKVQMQKFLARLSKMSSSSLAALSEMSSPQLNNFVADAAGKLSRNASVLKQIIAGARTEAGDAALHVISKVDDVITNNGTVPRALFAKMKDAASKLPPEKARAYLDLIKKKFSGEWSKIVDLENVTEGPGRMVGAVVDGIFVLNDAYDIYYNDDEPELKAIKATGKMIDYGVSSGAGMATAELGAAHLSLGAGLGVGLAIAFTANRVSTLYTEIAMLEREKADVKDREEYTRTNNRILMLRQFVNVSNKLKAGEIRNANHLLYKLKTFLLEHSSENEEKLFDLLKDLEEKSENAERNLLINGIINEARHPYRKALNFYKKGVELHLAKIYAAEALTILNNNLKIYPEIGGLTAISKAQQLINAINEKIANAANFSIARVAAPERVYVGQSIDIPVFARGGIPYYSSVGEIGSNISDDSEVTVFWYASVVPGIENFTITLKDCMGSIASTSVSIEVVENIIDDNNEVGEQITDNSPEGLEGCWVGWSVCGIRDIDCPIFQYFFKIQTKSEVRYYAISAWVQIIDNKYYIYGMDGSAEENISKKKIKGDGWELTKFKYPNIPEIPETSNETYENEIQGIMQELKEAKTSDERHSLSSFIGSINERIDHKIWSRIFYETALEWTNENKWQSFNYQTDESYYNGYADWWVCPDEVIAAFTNALKNKSNL